MGDSVEVQYAAHADALESEEEMSAPRYRPEEVAASGTVDGHVLPLGFRDAEKRGQEIVDELLHRIGRP